MRETAIFLLSVILTPNELVLTFGGLHLCVKFGENRQRNATVRVMTHGQTDRQTQTDFIICPIAICYSYGTDKNTSAVYRTIVFCSTHPSLIRYLIFTLRTGNVCVVFTIEARLSIIVGVVTNYTKELHGCRLNFSQPLQSPHVGIVVMQ